MPLLSLVVLSSMVASEASAYELGDARWADLTLPIPVWIGADLGEAGVDDKKGVASIGRAFESWQAVDCAAVQFEMVGRDDKGQFGDPPDQKNTVSLVEKGWVGDVKERSRTMLTVVDGTILEADIGLNAETFNFSIDGDGKSAYDIEGAVAHEVGHLLGLLDSDVVGATMNPAMMGLPEAQSLEKDDIEALCALYLPLPTDTSDPGDSGIAERAGQGEACARTDDCGINLLCVVDNGDQYCATKCSGNEDCESGTECVDPGSGSPVCITDRKHTACSTGAPREVSLMLSVTGLVLVGWRRRRAG